MTRLCPKNTKARAPGPGPMRKVDWKPSAEARLKGKKVVQHTDGARAYRLRVNGVVHEQVIHKKKQILVRGKLTWVQPKYIQALGGARRCA